MKKRYKRLVYIAGIFSLLLFCLFFALGALEQNISFFLTIQEVLASPEDGTTTLRVGGIVAPGSVRYEDGGAVTFDITDHSQAIIHIKCSGVLPPLFAEGKGIVAHGKKKFTNYFIADELLAKHDENYTPNKYKNIQLDNN